MKQELESQIRLDDERRGNEPRTPSPSGRWRYARTWRCGAATLFAQGAQLPA